MSRLLRGSLRTAPGPGGAGSIGHFTQPCRKIVLNYCQHSPASKGVRDWLSFGLRNDWQRIGAQNGVSVVGEKGPLDAAKSWPQIEWVIQEGKRGTEPTVTAYYVNSRTKTIPLHMLSATALPPKLHLLVSSTGRKLAGSQSRQGHNTSEARNYKKRVVESVRGAEPVRGHWSGFGASGS
ncbi:hypothetical protein BCV69DRAFT_296215 [Microstroma glucosiphilum]|uniref:Ribosomal protein/NADH dehydrogenase domain-containing protein n=1 Tax=Pseudomicrostroma glucosiphilum TaxID=1684307 RepID=A0A316UF70_9BASI|nr:hypothetical protein BCV69DRAFT_296215 [Pseudomicrostroma glucosiphilum]PWN23906.1 hypothetical protein BCV69DRAFT_296215 [Pseudomicrostroma glucosiphilum]